MDKIEIYVKLDGGNSELTMKGINNEISTKVVSGFFDALGVVKPIKQKELANARMQQMKVTTTEPKVWKKADREQVETTPVKSRPRQLPLTGTERSLNTPIGELLGAKQPENVPEYYKTGIKIDEDGTKRYKLRYWCECGGKGNHYVPLETDWVLCRDCENELAVEYATGLAQENGIPERDDFGNFFIAKENYIE